MTHYLREGATASLCFYFVLNICGRRWLIDFWAPRGIECCKHELTHRAPQQAMLRPRVHQRTPGCADHSPAAASPQTRTATTRKICARHPHTSIPLVLRAHTLRHTNIFPFLDASAKDITPCPCLIVRIWCVHTAATSYTMHIQRKCRMECVVSWASDGTQEGKRD